MLLRKNQSLTQAKKKQILILAMVLVAFLFMAGCKNMLLEFDVDYPTERFAETLKKIDRIHTLDPHRKGKVNQLNFLIYVGEERKLIAFSVPIETLQKTLSGDNAKNLEIDEVTEKVGPVKWEKFKKLENLGPGLLLEAIVEEQKGKVHLLIWFD